MPKLRVARESHAQGIWRFFVLQGLEVATNCVDDMDEWLGIFNVKLRHMREDIQSVGNLLLTIETRNNKLEVQSVNNKALIAELDKLVERFRFPSEYASCLTGSQFDEASVPQYVEACEWLTNALHGLEVPNLDSTFANIRAVWIPLSFPSVSTVREKRAELGILKATFVRKASEFLRICFATLVDFMINDKNYFSQRGQLKKPDHADLRYKCRTYARLLQHLKVKMQIKSKSPLLCLSHSNNFVTAHSQILDGNCLGPLRKAYCSSLNSLLRREAHEFSNELRASTKVSKTPNTWLETFTSGNQSANNADTSAVSDAYAKMLTIFVPLLVDEVIVHSTLIIHEITCILNFSGLQEDFYVLVDWAYKIDPLRCISLHGVTERYLSGQKSDAARFVRVLLGDLESKISMQFSRFVDEACHQIERSERNARQTGVLPYIPR
ncbi:exocyst complex component SEC3A-like [Gossypium australe]|uniref:Exocyst complex component SEC3A-like n=1 Tax=Gossypium australe TaxID=47621 RepID=A0A5B6VWY2_9ROSI|nr:exocyst complex component SEC3A-like [Gossypium australe]